MAAMLLLCSLERKYVTLIKVAQFPIIECSFCRLIRCPGSFIESLIGREYGSPGKLKGIYSVIT
jgi:hypothetical protein